MHPDGRFLPSMGRRASRHTTEHLVSHGRVGCPRSAGDVDLDRCYSCPLLSGMRTDASGLRWVRCRTVFGPLTPAGPEVV